MAIGKPAIFVDVDDDLQPIVDELLGEGYSIGYYENPAYCDPEFCHGESKWTTHVDIGPRTTGTEEELTSFEVFKERCIGALDHRPEQPYVDCRGLLAYLYTIGRIEAGTYVIHDHW